MAMIEPGARNSSQVSHMGGGDPSTEAFISCIPGCAAAGIWDWKPETVLEPGQSAQGTGVPMSLLYQTSSSHNAISPHPIQWLLLEGF